MYDTRSLPARVQTAATSGASNKTRATTSSKVPLYRSCHGTSPSVCRRGSPIKSGRLTARRRAATPGEAPALRALRCRYGRTVGASPMPLPPLQPPLHVRRRQALLESQRSDALESAVPGAFEGVLANRELAVGMAERLRVGTDHAVRLGALGGRDLPPRRDPGPARRPLHGRRDHEGRLPAEAGAACEAQGRSSASRPHSAQRASQAAIPRCSGSACRRCSDSSTSG